MTIKDDATHVLLRRVSPFIADVHVNGIVFEDLQVFYNPNPRYEGDRVHANVRIDGPDMEPFVEELYHSKNDLYVEIKTDDSNIDIRMDVEQQRHTLTESGDMEVDLRGWVSVRDR